MDRRLAIFPIKPDMVNSTLGFGVVPSHLHKTSVKTAKTFLPGRANELIGITAFRISCNSVNSLL